MPSKPITWKPVADEEFELLPTGKPDPVWGPLLSELAAGRAVRIDYKDTKERSAINRGLGKRASTVGFAVDTRYGDGFIVVRRTNGDEPTKSRRSRAPRVIEE